MKLDNLTRSRWAGDALALLAGALLHLGMAPYGLWPLSLLSLTTFAWVLRGLPVKPCLRRSYAFGLGLYGAGTSWIYVSISQFGNSSVALSLILTGVFVAAMALLFIPPFYLLGRLHKSPWAFWLGFPAVYVLGEWFHSWFLTGFPWLFAGYAFIDTPLAGWAPVFGVYGLTLAASIAGLCLVAMFLALWQKNKNWPQAAAGLVLLGSIVFGGTTLQQHNWTQLSTTPINLALVQPNIPQEEKWDPDYYAENIGIYRGLSKDYWGKVDWLVWPEAAIPLPFHRAEAMLDSLDTQGKQTNTTFFSGIIYDDIKDDKYYNDILAIGAGGSGQYFKQRLVPFGEYVPFDEQLRGLIEFFDLPTSIVHVGPPSRALLRAKNIWLAPAICYELVYPELIAQHSRDANAIMSISNNAWFGNSIGPEQHFEMARMRALETGRYLIHGTNNGVTAIINNKGGAELRVPRFVRQVATGTIYPAEGLTPFMLWGAWPVVLVAVLFLVFAWLRQTIVETESKIAVDAPQTAAPASEPADTENSEKIAQKEETGEQGSAENQMAV